MASLIKILAASLGAGLVLGAGIRLGGARAPREAGHPQYTRKPGERFDGMEARIALRLAKQETELSAIRSQVSAEIGRIDALGEISVRLERELPEWIEKSVARRIEEAEAELKAEAERSQKAAIEAFIDGVQTRVAHRISRLEEEVAMHSAALTELRECSLRTEASIEKLAGSIDRLVTAQPAAAAFDAPEEKRAVAAAGTRPSRPRRWGIFG